jgi:hypothetical protein
MTTLHKVISAWMLALIGSLLLPIISIAATSGATYDTPYTTTPVPATITEYTTADLVRDGPSAPSHPPVILQPVDDEVME